MSLSARGSMPSRLVPYRRLQKLGIKTVDYKPLGRSEVRGQIAEVKTSHPRSSVFYCFWCDRAHQKTATQTTAKNPNPQTPSTFADLIAYAADTTRMAIIKAICFFIEKEYR